VAAEVPLGDLSLRSPAERDTHMLQFINGPWSIFDQDFYGILVPQVIASLDRVIKIPFPAVFLLVSERSGDPSLGGPGMGACWKDFADDGDIGLIRHFNRGSKPCQTGSHNYDVMSENHATPTIYIENSFLKSLPTSLYEREE
jgi:hypothetical protein